MPKAEYRSSLRSKKLIKRAFAKLLLEKDISRITVTDIINEADISRGTFYAHYPDVYGVFDQIITEELNKLIEVVDDMGGLSMATEPEAFFTNICRYIQNDFDYYRTLILSKSVSNNFIARLAEVFTDDLKSEIMKMPEVQSDSEATMFLTYINKGLTSVMLMWVSGEIDTDADEVGATIGKLIKSTFLFFRLRTFHRKENK